VVDRERVEAARRTSPMKLLPTTYPVKPAGKDRWRLRCPLHDDSTPSLGVRKLDTGVWIWKCFGCDEAGDAIAFGMRVCGMTFADAVTALAGEGAPRMREVERYDYRDEAGSVLYQVIRYEPKEFRQRRRTDTGWQWGMDGVRRVLYRLPEAIAACRAGREVLYVEGERDVHTAEAAGLAAVTNSGGVGGFRGGLLNALPKSTRLVLVPDRDDPGMDLARHVYANAVELDMPPPRLVLVPTGKDLSEFVANGGDAVALVTAKEAT
jgi:DNA primase